MSTATSPLPVIRTGAQTDSLPSVAPGIGGAPRADSAAGGVAASLTASVFFAALYAIPGALAALGPTAVFAWRVLITLPFLTAILLCARQWPAFRALVRRIRRRPAVLAVIALDAALLSVQLWLFAWGPISGSALAVSLGYFLLPLVMVLAGVLLHRERLGGWRLTAIGFAALGVAVAVAAGRDVSWATFAVALGYPPYFILRRRFRLDAPVVLWAEFALLTPVALILATRPPALATIGRDPALVLPLLALGATGSLGFTAYVTANRRLSFSAFGLLGYVEPILLVGVATLILGEPLAATSVLSYAAIGTAVLVLAAEGVRDAVLSRAGSGDRVLRHRVLRHRAVRRPNGESVRENR